MDLDACQDIIAKYLEELKEPGYNAQSNVIVSTIKDLLGDSVDKFTEKYLREKLKEPAREKLLHEGFGNLALQLYSCQQYGNDVVKLVESCFDQDDPIKMLQKAKSMLEKGNYSILDPDVQIKEIANAVKNLSKAQDKLNTELEKYLAGDWDEDDNFLSSAWSGIKCLFNCPVNVALYDSAGVQVGYVGEDDVWYGDGIRIEENGASKVVYSLEPLTFKAAGTDYGTLTCVIESYENGRPAGRANFYHIPLENDQEVTDALTAEKLSSGETVLENAGKTVLMDEYIPAETDACVRISVSSENGDGGTVYGGGNYVRSDAVVLTARAAEGYRFAGWFAGNDLVQVSSVYEFTACDDLSLTAKFVEQERTLASDDINFSAQYADCTVTVEQTDTEVIVHLTSQNSTVPNAAAYLATYSRSGQQAQIAPLQATVVSNGIDFIGAAPEKGADCKLFLLDEHMRPLMEACFNG